MAGPPISIFSMASASVHPSLAMVASNGYRLITTMSMGLMPCCPATGRGSGRTARTGNVAGTSELQERILGVSRSEKIHGQVLRERDMRKLALFVVATLLCGTVLAENLEGYKMQSERQNRLSLRFLRCLVFSS